MVTIKDIAREAGVSISSVSRYFNNRRLLGEESRNRIEAVVNKYCYTPNSMGRCLRLARSGKILVLLPTMENPMYLRILSSIENECYQYGLTVLACDTHNDSYKEKHLLSMLTNHYADGAILFSSSLSGDELIASLDAPHAQRLQDSVLPYGIGQLRQGILGKDPPGLGRIGPDRLDA